MTATKLRESLGPEPWKPDGTKRAWAAHHIVPWTGHPHSADMSIKLRSLMFRCRLHPNARINGIYLRDSGLRNPLPAFKELKDSRPGLAARTYHPDTYRRDYYRVVGATAGYFAADDDCEIGGIKVAGFIVLSLKVIRDALARGELAVEEGR